MTKRRVSELVRIKLGQCLPGYDEDAALAAALEGSRVEALQLLVPQRQTAPALEDDESFARAIQESLNLEHQDRTLAYSGKTQPAQVCTGVAFNAQYLSFRQLSCLYPP